MLFKDVAHLYMGCYVWINGERSGQRILGVNHYANGVHIRLADQEYPVEYIKPEFTRPWELPTEVLEEVIKAKYRAITDIKISLGSHQIALFFSYRYGGTIEEKFICWDSLTASQFTILLKAGADLFNLIDAGEALDSKTLNQQTT